MTGGDSIKYPEGGDFPIIVFGDGGTAEVLNRYYKKDNKARDVCILKLKPEKDVMAKFDIGWSDLDDDGGLIREYPADYIHQVKYDPLDRIIWGFSDFNGNDTKITDLFREKTNKEKLNSLKEIIEGLRTENAALRQKLFTLQQCLFKFDEENMKRYKLIKKRIHKEDEEDYMGEEV